MRLFMKYRQTHSVEVAAAKASISRATAFRIEKEQRLPSQNKPPRGRRRPDPLEHIFDAEVVPLLKAAPGIRASGKHDQVVNYHHVIHSLRKKPMALLNLVYRDKLFPRPEYRRAFDTLIEQLPDRQACKVTVELLALAHDRGCERELAEELARTLDARKLPDLMALRAIFGPDPDQLPTVHVQLASLNSYEALMGSAYAGEAA
uniref:hypothetical protein n=1 Tax=Sinorhizobium medicae TaxID=110321 RepID=UPI0013E2F9DF|nr:hypothetical protein [Sinorhizobium medicae]